MLLLLGCSTIKYIPVKEYVTVTETQTEYLRDTLIQVKVEKEFVRDYTGLLDTLQLETSYALSSAWVDTTRNTLAGTIKNKDKVIDVPVAVKEKVIVKDSLVYKDVPVPVEVVKTVHPKYEAWLWTWLVLSVAALVVFAYLWGKRKHIW